MKKLLVLAGLLTLCSLKSWAVSQPHSIGNVSAKEIILAPTNVTGLTSTSSSIIPTASYLTFMSTGSNLILKQFPTISTTTTFGGSQSIPDGFLLVLGSTASISYTLLDNSVLSGTLLNLSGLGASVVSSTSSIKLIFNQSAGRWNQVR